MTYTDDMPDSRSQSPHSEAAPPPLSMACTFTVTGLFDPIFLKRDTTYSRKERDYICSLLPLRSLPLNLIPTDEDPRRPLINFGWVLPESVKKRLHQRAVEHNCVQYMCHRVPNPDYKPGRPGSSETLLVPQRINEWKTLELALRSILEEIDVDLPINESITMVLAPSSSRSQLFLALFTNHDLDDLPNDAVIEAISEEFKFTEPPYWYPSSFDFDWGYCPY
ncbi:hypothetical protein EIP86_007075 [Pleurotus ostreatoroseus]|nr:hypothetical protein EIP86_007075 [Pleurotus ostreatoroseus]